MAEPMLRASVETWDCGRVLVLSGETDLTCAPELRSLIGDLISRGTRQLMVDVSGLRFADSASIREWLLAARTLKERDGCLVLLDPQEPVARMLALTGADHWITVRVTRPPSGPPAA